MSLLLDIADAIAALPLPELLEPRTCKGCHFLKNGSCSLWSGDCLNNLYRPEYQKDYSNPPFGVLEGGRPAPLLNP